MDLRNLERAMANDVSMHKRMAMGEKVVTGYKRGGAVVGGYMRGGTVGSDVKSVSVKPGKGTVNPLRGAKATNGVPGFKGGGCMKKGGK